MAAHRPLAGERALAGAFRKPVYGETTGVFTQLGGTTYSAVNTGGSADQHLRVAATQWTTDGTVYQAQVTWSGDAPADEPPADAGQVVGTVNGHPAYHSATSYALNFWTGARGYAALTIFSGTQGVATAVSASVWYEIDAKPLPATTPTPTGTFTSTGLVSSIKTVDGVGITVSTDKGGSGSASAPSVAQVLADVTSLGTDPSGWTTNVLVG